ncbi:MAG: LysM peptidoglycan-binding domain-containing protein, partial [bacterium]
ARSAYLSVNYDVDDGSVSVTCLQGTCSFGASTGGIFISPGEKLDHAESNTTSEPMSLADYGEWGVNVAEATQLAFYATEALSQGSATLPVVPTETPSPAPPTETPAPTATLAPNQPSPTERPPSETPTRVIPTATPVPFTPIPPAPIIGRHAVKAGETLFCIARVYGVLPAAIAQASGIPSPFTVFPGQVLRVPAVQWVNILPGPVCAPQFQSPFPGLPFATETPGASATAANPPLSLSLNLQCVVNCGSNQGDYTIRIEALVSGGAEPYTFDPGQTFERTFPHCVDGAGTVTVTSADGQTASAPWSFHDVSCVPTAEPTPAPTLTPSPVTP